jgi:hypothetical protein
MRFSYASKRWISKLHPKCAAGKSVRSTLDSEMCQAKPYPCISFGGSLVRRGRQKRPLVIILTARGCFKNLMFRLRCEFLRRSARAVPEAPDDLSVKVAIRNERSSPILGCLEVKIGLVWSGLVWPSLVWPGLAWSGLAWDSNR